MDNQQIRAEARALLQNKWGSLALVWLIYGAICAIIPSVTFGVGSFAQLLIGGPFMLAICTIFLKLFRHEDFRIEELFDGFKDFTRTLVAYLLVSVYVLLWMLLLIVPGIIAAIGYSMTFFIMAEDPKITAEEAMRKSKMMMYGHRTEFFMLMLSFIGWFILACFTFGIGFLFLGSYTQMAATIFYQRIKAQPAQSFAQETPPPPINP